MSLKLGNINIAGTQVLYSTTGNNTDGAMTQNATTTQLNLKANDIDVVHKTGNEYYTGQKDRNIEGLDTSTAQWVDGNSAILTQYDDTNFVNSIEYYYNIVKDNQYRYILYNTCAIFNNGIKNQLSARTRNTANTANVNCDFALYALKDGTKYITAPASDVNGSIVTTVNKSKAANGYFQLGNGLIIQWGTSETLNESSSLTITLPKAFTSTNYSVTANFKVQHTAQDAEGAITVDNFTTTTFRISAGYLNPNSGKVSWIAIGY